MLLGVGSGCLLPSSHQPYDAAAPLERSSSCSPSPLHKANKPLHSVTSAHSPTLAATGAHSGVVGDFGDQRAEPISEKDSIFQEYPVLSVQPSLSRAFIDSPFCSRRPALRELPFAAPTGVAWGVASPSTADAWTTPDNHQPPNVSESRGRWGDRSETENLFASSLAVGVISARSGDETRPGLDLSGIRETEPPAYPLSRSFLRGTPSFRARGEEVLWSFTPDLDSKQGDKSDMTDWQAEHAMGVLDRSTGRGQPDEGVWRLPIWGESDGGEEGIDVRYAEGQKNNSPVQEELGLRAPDGVEATKKHGCEVGPTYPRYAYLYSISGVWPGKTTRAQFSTFLNHGRLLYPRAMCLFQVDLRQGGGALTLMGEPSDAGQAKFVPVSAQHFHSTQVIVKEETTGPPVGTKVLSPSLVSGETTHVL